MKDSIKRYRVFLILLTTNFVVLLIWPQIGKKSLDATWSTLLSMLLVLPPIFILMGLLDVWVERDTMIRFMGEESGLIGAAVAFFIGSVAAGPLYAAFPVAGVLIKKGCKLSNILIFIGAWSTTKIPMLLFETTSMGLTFTLTRFLVDIPGIAVIAFITERVLNKTEKQHIYDKAVL